MRVYTVKAKIPVSEIRNVIDPLDGALWDVTPITFSEVLELDTACHIDESWNAVKKKTPQEMDTRDVYRTFHIGRIAYLVNKTQPTCTAEAHLTLLSVMHDGDIKIIDGNHRIAAAIIRGDTHFKLKIITPEPNALPSIFPNIEILD